MLLTSFDLSVRMHHLNARQALRRLLAWHAVPVVNENDTTATDEITFGDNGDVVRDASTSLAEDAS